jgi:TorA maturation chaperone TorD
MTLISVAAVDDALARAVVYRTLSLGFQAPTLERLSEVGARDGFPIIASALRHLERRAERVDLGWIATRLASSSPPEVETVAATFARLFGHTSRGLVCACETEYGPDNAFHQPQQLADIAGYYLAFGLRPSAASEARVDHIACEIEFMDFLNRKQAWLLTHDDGASESRETLEATERAERTFLRDHLARFGRAFAARVVAEDPDGYFGALGGALLAFLGAECARQNVEAGPVDLVVRPDAVDDTPMACGSADELIQIQRKP